MLKMKVHRNRIIVGLIIFVSIFLVAFQALQTESSIAFFTPEEVYVSKEKFYKNFFRLSGVVSKGTKSFDKETFLLTFQLSDLQGHDFNVLYKGAPPDLLKESQGVIVEGKLVTCTHNDGRLCLKASKLIVKHSEVYDTKFDKTLTKQHKLINSLKMDKR
jgi:cytochrome c-type biogenesis protein CcmE